jgi:hypothetical protein
MKEQNKFISSQKLFLGFPQEQGNLLTHRGNQDHHGNEMDGEHQNDLILVQIHN